jgi:hypothetical protein
MAGNWFEAILGKLYNNGTELELLGGLNFKSGIKATADFANGRYDVAIDSQSASGIAATHFDGPGAVGSNGVFRAANDAGGYVAVKSDGTSTVLVGGYVDSFNNTLYGRGTGPYVAPGNTAWYVLSGGSFFFRVNGETTEWQFSATQLDCFGNDLANVGRLNGATVAAPVEGTALTDAAQTLAVAGGNNYVQAVALTASRTKTLSNTGPETGEVITIIRTTTAAFTMPIVNGGVGGGTPYTFPVSAKRVADFRFDGVNWVLAGVKRLP